MATPETAPRPGLLRRVADLAVDGAGIAGAGLIVAGTDMVYRPAGFIVGGMFLLFASWTLARKAA